MVNDRDTMVKGYAMLGILSVSLFIVFCLIAMVADGSWEYNRDMLCELGVSDSLLSCFLFLSACVFSGVGLSMCGAFLFGSSTGFWRRARYLFLVIGGAALVFVGIFNMHTSVHEIFTTTLATATALGMIVSGVEDILLRRWVPCTVTLVAGLTIIYLFLFEPKIVQAVTILLTLLWIGYRCTIAIRLDA